MRVTAHIVIDEAVLEERFIRASGPGGQNVNKLASAVQLRFDLEAATLPASLKRRLRKLAGRRLTREGQILIEASEHRRQDRNRREARRRLAELVRRAATPPPARKKTRPTRGSKERRLEAKKARGRQKRLRRRPGPGTD